MDGRSQVTWLTVAIAAMLMAVLAVLSIGYHQTNAERRQCVMGQTFIGDQRSYAELEEACR